MARGLLMSSIVIGIPGQPNFAQGRPPSPNSKPSGTTVPIDFSLATSIQPIRIDFQSAIALSQIDCIRSVSADNSNNSKSLVIIPTQGVPIIVPAGGYLQTSTLINGSPVFFVSSTGSTSKVTLGFTNQDLPTLFYAANPSMTTTQPVQEYVFGNDTTSIPDIVGTVGAYIKTRAAGDTALIAGSANLAACIAALEIGISGDAVINAGAADLEIKVTDGGGGTVMRGCVVQVPGFAMAGQQATILTRVSGVQLLQSMLGVPVELNLSAAMDGGYVFANAIFSKTTQVAT